MSDPTQQKQFGFLRGYLWPVHRHEAFKVAALLLIFFLIALIYNLLRCLKDVLVVTTSDAGAGVIPFLKLYMMFPGAILFTFLYTRVANYFAIDKVFYVMIGGFLSFFVAFMFLYLPNSEALQLDYIADYLRDHLLPSGWRGFESMVRFWGYSLFYVMSELWGNIILFLVVWGFINQVMRLEQAQRIYALFGFGMNLSSISAGQLSEKVSLWSKGLQIGSYSEEWTSLVVLVAVVVVCGLLACAVFYGMSRKLFKDVRYQKLRKRTSKIKLSLSDSLRYIANNRYLLCLAIIVVAYNILINLCEVTWKEQAKMLYLTKDEYLQFMGRVTTKVGIVSTLISLFILGNTFRFGGWTFTAMITPVILLITSVAFFGTLILSDGVALSTIVFLGTLQNVMSRSSKYTVYDATKEVAFTPLDQESKLKGKASIDGVGTRLGKSGGAAINMALMGVMGSLSASIPYIAGVIFIVLIVWMIAVKMLGEEFAKIGGKLPDEELDEENLASAVQTPSVTEENQKIS